LALGIIVTTSMVSIFYAVKEKLKTGKTQ